MPQKRNLVFLVLATALWLGVATVAEDKADLSLIWKIKDEGFNRSQVMEILSYLTDVHGPRLTGSPNMKAANEWTQKKLEEWGLENAHLESFDFGRGWSLERFSAHMTSPDYQPLIGFPKSWTPGTNGPVSGEVVRVDIQQEKDFEKYRGKLRGVFVMAQPEREVEAIITAPSQRFSDEALRGMAEEPIPGARGRGRGRGGAFPDRRFLDQVNEFFVNEGVAAVIEPGRGDGGTVFVGSGGGRNSDSSPVPAQVVLAVEHFNRISRILAKDIKVNLEMEIRTRFHDQDLKGYNTIAEIPGADKKDEVVMVGAHLDSHHSGTGATDNAAGCAVAMEAMRIIKAIGIQPRRTIRIGLWSGEEQGLLGSRAYVSEHFASSPPAQGGARGGRGGAEGPLNIKAEHAKFAGYFNLDNGTGKVRGVYLQGNEEVRPIFEKWLAPFKDLGATTLAIRNTGGTDHLSFDRVGLPGFQFIQDPVEYNTRTHHSNMDVYDRIQREDMMQAAVIMASFALHAAMREEKLPRKPLPEPRPQTSTGGN